MTPTLRPQLNGLPIASPLPRDANVSFEFFPPKTEKMEAKLWECVERLGPLKPKYVSVTYGAGGSTRERTHATVARIRRETDLEPAAHLTCVGATRAEINDIARRYWADGIKHIVALRGDPVDGIGQAYVPHPGGYAYAEDLVKGLKNIADFEISVAGYPEKHPQADSLDADIAFLKRKVNAGANRIITQSFFDTEKFLQFVDKARDAGITVPIVPGILPVTNFKRVQEFSASTGTSVPKWMAEIFEGLDDDAETRKLVAASVVAEQCRVLYANGIKDFHFYTLNRADLTYAICHILGVRP
ncbi:MAG: methylenetetrahydrofolate reductase [Magnetovibrio sp.]|nr:methylenetetrahydrofolate reductase [Magnetovibrio sp.]